MTPIRSTTRPAARFAPAVRAAVAAAVALSLATAQDRKVVCYVSHDFEHAEAVLKAFETATGVKVEAVSDTEDNKTIGLANRLIAEAGKTKADVFWNNEVGQAVRLQSKGLLEPYASPNAATIPAAFKDPAAHWTGFAARARVLIYNTKMIRPEDLPKRHADLADPRFKGKVAMARPLTGTTLTHAGVLIARDGFDATRDFYERLKANDVLFEKGNAYVMRLVADGVRPMAMTDTDDAHVATLNGAPTQAVLLDQGPEDVGAVLIPNAAMILKGAPHPEEARRLVDFLLRPETEAMLAAGRAAQIPLHPGVPRPAHVKGVEEIRAFPADWAAAGRAVDERFADLARLFERPAGEGGSGAWIVVGIALLLAVVAARRRRERAAA